MAFLTGLIEFVVVWGGGGCTNVGLSASGYFKDIKNKVV